jgi:hypothetical protein
LKNIIFDDTRINLYGKPVSNVTQFDRDFAKDILGASVVEKPRRDFVEARTRKTKESESL